MTKIRVLVFLITIFVVGSLGYLFSLYARGYRLDPKTLKFRPNGLLVVKTDPEAASIYVNGELESASNATLSLSPGNYDVRITKDGYFPWEKRLTIEKEIVTEADVSIFKSVPFPSPITFSGAINPVVSPDFTKIAYATNPGGLWIVETLNLPLGFAREPRQIADGDFTQASWQWSPDARELLVTTKSGVYLLNASSFTAQKDRVNIASKKADTLTAWDKERATKTQSLLANLPNELLDIFSRKTSQIAFSPDETKIAYVASASATISDNLIRGLPGASTQKQERNLEPNKTYIYDIKEDRNFLVDSASQDLAIDPYLASDGQRRLYFLSTSRQLTLVEDGKITVMDYDGTNRQVVYSGIFTFPFAFPFANTSKLIILTNLGGNSSPANLYSLSLK